MIKVVRGDITKNSADAIVNAANSMLSNQAGVARAISLAGGTAFQKEAEDNVRQLGEIKTGQARPQRAQGDLKCQYVINAVGPVYDPNLDQSGLLFSAYYNSLRVAFDLDLKIIAFPAISTGIFSYPPAEAAKVAIDALKKGLVDFDFQSIEIVILPSEEFDQLANLFQKELVQINPFFNNLSTEAQEKLIELEREEAYPLSLQGLADLTRVDFSLLSQFYQLGLIPNRKSIGEPEIFAAGAQVGFFLSLFEREELEDMLVDFESSKDPTRRFLAAAFQR
jgi:O-acetyl-ADP-ribose deacetylase (regulator of RNase III)